MKSPGVCSIANFKLNIRHCFDEIQNPNLDLPKDRAMPKDRTTPYAITPHPQTTDKRAPNTLLIDDLKMILINYKNNPEKWTLEYIVARYDISEEIAGNFQYKFN